MLIINLEREVKTIKRKNLSTRKSVSRLSTGQSDRVRVSGGHLCAEHRSTDRGGSRDLEPAATSCGARKLFSAWSVNNFRPRCHFELAVSHTVSARSQCLTPTGGQSAAKLNPTIQIKKAPVPYGTSAFLVRVTGLEPAAS